MESLLWRDFRIENELQMDKNRQILNLFEKSGHALCSALIRTRIMWHAVAVSRVLIPEYNEDHQYRDMSGKFKIKNNRNVIKHFRSM